MLQRVSVLQAAAQCVFELGHRRKQPIVGSPAALSTPAAALPSGQSKRLAAFGLRGEPAPLRMGCYCVKTNVLRYRKEAGDELKSCAPPSACSLAVVRADEARTGLLSACDRGTLHLGVGVLSPSDVCLGADVHCYALTMLGLLHWRYMRHSYAVCLAQDHS
jgi:hypothetical protein